MSPFWMVALDRPNSLIRSRTRPIAATIASRPKACGGNRRASTTSVPICPSTRTIWAPRRTAPPRRERRPRSWVRWSVASSCSGDRAPLADTSLLGDGALGADIVQEPAIGLFEPVLERSPGVPAELLGVGGVDHLARRAMGPRAVEAQGPLEADDIANQLDQLADRHVEARPEIDDLLVRVAPHEIDHAVGGVVDMKELAAHRAGAPDVDVRRVGE